MALYLHSKGGKRDLEWLSSVGMRVTGTVDSPLQKHKATEALTPSLRTLTVGAHDQEGDRNVL